MHYTLHTLNRLCCCFFSLLLLRLFRYIWLCLLTFGSVDGRLINLRIFFCVRASERASEWVSVVFSLIYYFSLDVFFLSHSCVRSAILLSFRIRCCSVSVSWRSFGSFRSVLCVGRFFTSMCIIFSSLVIVVFGALVVRRFMCLPSSFIYSPVCTCRSLLCTHTVHTFIPYVLYTHCSVYSLLKCSL